MNHRIKEIVEVFPKRTQSSYIVQRKKKFLFWTRWEDCKIDTFAKNVGAEGVFYQYPEVQIFNDRSMAEEVCRFFETNTNPRIFVGINKSSNSIIYLDPMSESNRTADLYLRVWNNLRDAEKSMKEILEREKEKIKIKTEIRYYDVPMIKKED